MRFELTLLGTSSALPLPDRFTTAQILDIEGRLFLFDCGEGVQIRLRQLGFRPHRIEAIFISHLHGDHILGLPGLLDSMTLHRREHPLSVFGPPGLAEMLAVNQRTSGSRYSFPLQLSELETERSERVFENARIEVRSFPLLHRIPTVGYLLREQIRPPNMRKEVIRQHGLEVDQIKRLKAGQEVMLESGSSLTAEEATLPAPAPRSFAFCTDTLYVPELADTLRGVDLLYHEATYCEAHADLVRETMHTTARQAALLAREAKVGTLVIGHFSTRYPELDCFEKEAQALFSNSLVGRDGLQIRLPLRAGKVEVTQLPI
jgi:ribonuclease Z